MVKLNMVKLNSIVKLTLTVIGVTLAAGVLLFGVPIALRYLDLAIDDFLAVPRALFVWPVTALVLGLVFLLRFKAPIEHLIKHGRFTLPGGVQIQSQQPPESEGAPTPDTALTPEQNANLTAVVDELQQQSQVAAGQIEQLSRAHSDALRNAVLWEFKYLDLFLVPMTKQVLRWLSQFTTITRQGYEAVWSAIIVDPQQRTITLDVLLAHSLAEESSGHVHITPKGRALLAFLGIPAQPVPHPANPPDPTR